jgi:hypothetical protein
VSSQASVGHWVTTGVTPQTPESQKLWEKSSKEVEESRAHELAQTVVSGTAVQNPLAPQVWQEDGQAATSQQNPSVQLPVMH